MNGTQLFDALKDHGLQGDEYGHMFVVMETWCGSPLSVIIHPTGDDNPVRSVTMVIAANRVDMEHGRPFAAFVPTIYGDVLSDWEEVLEGALVQAQLAATAYIASAYEGAGFDQEKFLQATLDDPSWDDESRHQHLARRLEAAVLRQRLVEKSEMLMDLPDGETKDTAKIILDMSWAAYEQGVALLSKKDRQ